jgi:WD40 repeat protein
MLSLVDLESAQQLRQWQSRTPAVNAVTFLPEGQRAVSVGPDGTLRVWHVGIGRLLKEIRGDWKEVYKLLAYPEGRSVFLATGRNHAARMVGLETSHEIRRWEEGANITALALSPDGRQAAVALPSPNGGSLLRLYDVSKGERVREWSLPGLVNDLAYAHDGRHLLTANANGTAYILRL